MADLDPATVIHDDIGLGVSWFAAREAHRRSLEDLYVWSEQLGPDLVMCADAEPPRGVSFVLSRVVDGIRLHADESVISYTGTRRVMLGYRYLPWRAFVAGSGGYGV